MGTKLQRKPLWHKNDTCPLEEMFTVVNGNFLKSQLPQPGKRVLLIFGEGFF